MSAISISPVFPTFSDTTGAPLESGYIYIGTAGTSAETNQVSVYWDDALTIPASQPIRTIGGYPVYNGSPAVVYVDGDYSITVKNKQQNLVYSALNLKERISTAFITGAIAIVNGGTGADNAEDALTNLGAAKAGPLADSGITGAAASGANSDITSLQSSTTVTTQAASDSSTKIASTAFVRQFRQIAQIATFQTGTFATGSTTIPADNTIPQITEGDQYLSLAFTPTNASSTLEIDVEWIGSNGAGSTTTVALFEVGTANALAAAGHAPGSLSLMSVPLKHLVSAGSTSARTYTVRAGSSSGSTLTFNGVSAGQFYGGVIASRITIKEYLP